MKDLQSILCAAVSEWRGRESRKTILLKIEGAYYEMLHAGYVAQYELGEPGSEANQRRIERHLVSGVGMSLPRIKFWLCFSTAIIKALPDDLRLKVLSDYLGGLGVGVFLETRTNRSDLVDLAKILSQSVFAMNTELLEGGTGISVHLARMKCALSQVRTAA